MTISSSSTDPHQGRRGGTCRSIQPYQGVPTQPAEGADGGQQAEADLAHAEPLAAT